MKKTVTIIFLFALVILLTSCKKDETTNEEVYRIGLMPGLISAPYFYAQDHGIFEKYGINVELQLFRSAQERDMMFQGGKLDAVSTDLIAALLYLNAGKEIVITSHTEEEFRLVSSKDFTVTDDHIANIEKAKIGISENTVVDYLVSYVMKKNNIQYVERSEYADSTESQIYTTAPYPSVRDRFIDLGQGDIDMAIMPEPFPSLIEQTEDGNELWSNLDEGLIVTAFVVDKAYAITHYETIKNMNLAINEAIDEMMAGEYEDYHDVITNPDPKRTLIPAEHIQFVEEQELHHLKNPDEAVFNDVVAWCKERNLISKDYELKDLLFPYILEDL